MNNHPKIIKPTNLIKLLGSFEQAALECHELKQILKRLQAEDKNPYLTDPSGGQGRKTNKKPCGQKMILLQTIKGYLGQKTGRKSGQNWKYLVVQDD